MNGFELHGIKHLSASSCNSYVANQALWVLEKLYKTGYSASPAALRGNASEDGVTHGLRNPDASIEECVEVALDVYDEKRGLNATEAWYRERKLVPGYVEQALKELRPYGAFSKAQGRVKIELEGVPVPLIGFTDYVFEDHGLIVDLKTTARLPSKISDAHMRQGAIYSAAHSNFGMRFCYTKPAPGKDGISSRVYEMDAAQVKQSLAELTHIATRMERFLSLSKDREELAALVVPDYSQFFWNDDNRAAARAVFGF